MSSSLDNALSLWRLGLSVIPVPRPRPEVPPGTVGDGKVPAIAWKEFQGRRASEQEIREWFNTEQNIAVVTGTISGVVVVDADSSEATRWIVRHLHRTPWQTRTSRGYHMWYQHPGGTVRNRARIETRDGRLAIDVRGDRGYVIAPGSLHASGQWYQWGGDWSVPRERLPVFWRGWLQKPSRPSTPRPPSNRPTGDVIERARRYLATIPKPELGRGSDQATLYVACKLARGFAISEADAAALIWEWAGGREGWTLDWVERKVRNAVQYGSEPIGNLR